LADKIVIFTPHPDDETLGCGGTTAKKISEGYEVNVVVLTDGRNALSNVLGIFSDPTPEELKTIRHNELLSAIEILGVPKKNVVFLDFEDGRLDECEKEAEEKIMRILVEKAPREIYFPFKRDAHPDHRATNRIVKRCLRRLESPPISYQYSILHKYSRVGPFLERLLQLFINNRVEVDISGFANLKERAVNEFRSEMPVVSARQKKPPQEHIQKYLKKIEVFYISK